MSIIVTATQTNTLTLPVNGEPLLEHGVRISGHGRAARIDNDARTNRGVRISGAARGVRISGRSGVRISGVHRGVRISARDLDQRLAAACAATDTGALAA